MVFVPNRFRPIYRELSQADKDRINAIRVKAEELAQLYDCYLPTTGQGYAMKHLQDSVMWITKEATK